MQLLSAELLKFKYFSIKYRYSYILLKKNINFIYNLLLCCNHTCYSVNMVYVTSASRYITSASRYHPRYQSRFSIYIRCLILRNFAERLRQFRLAHTCVYRDQMTPSHYQLTVISYQILKHMLLFTYKPRKFHNCSLI